jgi:leader peptidase (prepilin peptidase)/N-methyltransferase
MTFIAIVTFILGLCVGSFLNVCIYRIPLEKSIVSPPSSCPGCGNRLKAIDMIPVLSYILLKGKCRNCKAPISIQYPLVELVTGIVWLVTFLRYGLSIETLMLIFLFTILIPVFLIDLVHMIIPNGLVITGLIGGAVFYLYHLFIKPISLYDSSHWSTPLIGMVSSSGILFLVALLSFVIYKNDGGMGMGDVKIFLPIGLILGWKLSLLTLFASIMFGGITSIVLLILRIKDRKSAIPFGPFIVLATFVCGMFGYNILNWYLGML